MALERSVELMNAGRALADARFEDVSAAVQRMSQGSSVPGGFGMVGLFYAARLVEATRGLGALTGMMADISPLDRFAELRPIQRMNGLLGLARVNAKLGAHATARRILSSIDGEQHARMPVRYCDLYQLCWLAEIYQALGDRAGAAALHQQLLPYAALNAVGPALDYEGAVAYYLLTAQPVFEGKNLLAICRQHVHDAPVAPSDRIDRDLPADLEDLVLRCLAKRPEDRPSSARELRALLPRWS